METTAETPWLHIFPRSLSLHAYGLFRSPGRDALPELRCVLLVSLAGAVDLERTLTGRQYDQAPHSYANPHRITSLNAKA